MADEQNQQAQNQQAANQPLNPDLMGYPTVEALVNAKRASDQEAARIIQERDALKQQIQYLYQPPENPRQEVKQRGTPADRLTEFGIPVDALNEYVGAEIQRAFAPIAAGVKARQTVLSQYPDYNKFESDVAQFIESDPAISQTYQRLFQADAAGAMEWAFGKFGESRRRTQPAGADSIMQEVGSHAGIPSSRNGEGRRPENNQNESRRAFEQWQKTGNSQDALAFAHARLKTAISDDFLNQ